MPKNHPDIPNGAPVVTCKNTAVNAINEKKLDLIDEMEYVVEATVRSHTQKKNIKPYTDATGTVRNTPLQKTLKLKVGARVSYADVQYKYL